MTVKVEYLRLKFPLNVDVRGLEVLQKGDTMLIASDAQVNVSIIPLLTGNINASDIELRDIYLKLGTPDSASYIRAQVDSVSVNDVALGLSKQRVAVDNIKVAGGDIKITLRNDSTPEPPTPATPTHWNIEAGQIALGNIDFEMITVESGDTLRTGLDDFKMINSAIDLGKHTLNVDDIIIDGVAARYIVGSNIDDSKIVEVQMSDSIESDTIPWAIAIQHLKLDNGRVTYATAGAIPQPGFDARYIDIDRLAVDVDSFYNRGADMRVPIKELMVSERSGLQLFGAGVLSMNSQNIEANDFNFRTLASTIQVDAEYGLTSVDAPLFVSLRADIDPIDMMTTFPTMKESIAMLPQHRKIEVNVDASGSLTDLHIDNTRLAMRNYFDVQLVGEVKNVLDFNNALGHLDITGDFNDINFIKPTLVEARLGKAEKMPPLRLAGAVDIASGVVRTKLNAVTAGGDLALNGKCNLHAEGYEIALNAEEFPVGSFLPGLGVNDVTAKIEAQGRGVDILSRSTLLTAKVDAISVDYRGHSLHDMNVNAIIADGVADINLTSANDVIDGNMTASGNLVGEDYEWSMIGDFRNVDLYALGVMDTVSNVATSMAANMKKSATTNDLSAGIELHHVKAVLGNASYGLKDFNVDYVGSDSTSQLFVDNQDMNLKFSAPMLIDSVASNFATAFSLIEPMIESRKLEIDVLQQKLPEFNFDIEAGERNALHDYLLSVGMNFSSLSFNAKNDSIINIDAKVNGFESGTTRLDKVDFVAKQEGPLLNYILKIDNEPGTLDELAHVVGSGFIGGDKILLSLNQQNIQKETGYKLGAFVEFSDSTMRLRLDPTDPIIGYRQWQVNPDNGITFNTDTYHLDANLLMTNNDSRLHIYTLHDSIPGYKRQENFNVDISKIRIAEWITLSPYASPMKGELSADLQFALSPGSLNGEGTVTLADFIYDKRRVGTIDLDFDVATSNSGIMTAKTGLKVDGREVMRATGALNDTTQTEPVKLDFALTRLPMTIANPFLGKSTNLSGYLSGDMDIIGSVSEPIFNGYLKLDSATMKLATLGTTFKFSEEKIPIDSNVIFFDNFSIYGVNKNPLEINGKVDMRSLSNVKIDLKLLADNMQIIGNDKRRGSDVYGKAFVSVDAKAQGDMNYLNTFAKISVKEGTNVTYVMTDASTSLASQSAGNMVQFVNFTDTTATTIVGDSLPSLGMVVNLDALLNVEEGAVIGVDLSANGQNRVQVQSNGSIDFSINPLGDTRATGRLNITGGYVRYSPPLMSEKMFKFRDGSYVALNGNIANPIVNVSAVDVVKANVTQEGQNSRLINFDVILRVNGTLSEMDVAFDLDTNEDVTVRNELQSMSPEQRANQAMNLLLYNMYTGPSTKGNASIAGNPLYSFLSSQVNTWMANNVKFVDVSVGIDQYERTFDGASSTTTNYSYQVSKSFLDDRFKVRVGGNYSTDVDPDENVSQNLFNDISVEYLINKSGTMYVKLFRHTGYESILEGEVTQTGVGFVYRRKLRALGEMFNRNRSMSKTTVQEEALRLAGEILRSVAKTNKEDEAESK